MSVLFLTCHLARHPQSPPGVQGDNYRTHISKGLSLLGYTPVKDWPQWEAQGHRDILSQGEQVRKIVNIRQAPLQILSQQCVRPEDKLITSMHGQT